MLTAEGHDFPMRQEKAQSDAETKRMEFFMMSWIATGSGVMKVALQQMADQIYSMKEDQQQMPCFSGFDIGCSKYCVRLNTCYAMKGVLKGALCPL